MPDDIEALRRLAEHHGIELIYYTIEGRRHDAKPEVLLAVLKALGAPLHRIQDAPDAMNAFQGKTSQAGSPHPSPLPRAGEGGRKPGEGNLPAPSTAFLPPSGERRWGVFIPLYALRSAGNWGIGDFTDLELLVDWTADLGGGIVGTLPLLASFLDEPFAPCPYTPVSRMFWNELFIDVERIPEMRTEPQAASLVSSPGFQEEIRKQREAPLVDYKGVMRLKRKVLEILAESISNGHGNRSEAFRTFLASQPGLKDYARFRAATERLKRPWRAWPEPARNGAPTADDVDPRAERYHAYVQWIAHEQMTAVACHARSRNVLLYLDFPLGVHPDGYDAWRHRDSFVEGISVGAPPDPFFSKGQRWGFSPLHPHTVHGAAGRLWTDSLRHHMDAAGMLRIDHVMGLHRLFWIPDGFEAVDGVYVRYPTTGLYDALCRNSLTHRTVLVGEDLGTVPEELRPTLHARGILRLFILSFEQDLTAGRPLPTPPSDCIAGLNTHDIPPFAALWGARADPAEMLRRCQDHLAAGPAFATLVNLEDLWLETEPQNRPGTSDEYPNWQRKARRTFEEFSADEGVTRALRRVNRLRSGPFAPLQGRREES